MAHAHQRLAAAAAVQTTWETTATAPVTWTAALWTPAASPPTVWRSAWSAVASAFPHESPVCQKIAHGDRDILCVKAHTCLYICSACLKVSMYVHTLSSEKKKHTPGLHPAEQTDAFKMFCIICLCKGYDLSVMLLFLPTLRGTSLSSRILGIFKSMGKYYVINPTLRITNQSKLLTFYF